MNIPLKEKFYMGTFIIAVLFLRTFSVLYLSLMLQGGNLKTKRNKAYEFLNKKFSCAEIFRVILSEIPYKKSYFPIITDYTRYPVKKFFLQLPFFFRVTDSEMKGKKRKSEPAFIRAVRKIIPEQYRMVITEDRESAGKEFIRNILRIKNTEAVIRIKKNADTEDSYGKVIRLGKPEKSLTSCFYRKKQRCDVCR
jgi:hypothetical protein